MSMKAVLHPNWGRGAKFSSREGVKGDWEKKRRGIWRFILANFGRVCLLSGLSEVSD